LQNISEYFRIFQNISEYCRMTAACMDRQCCLF
jgi:hypothetical protein